MVTRNQRTRIKEKCCEVDIGWSIIYHTIISPISDRPNLLFHIVRQLEFGVTEELVKLSHYSEPEKKHIRWGGVRGFKALY
jgi:hypothetical protein